MVSQPNLTFLFGFSARHKWPSRLPSPFSDRGEYPCITLTKAPLIFAQNIVVIDQIGMENGSQVIPSCLCSTTNAPGNTM